ncbi:MAG: hypothetical protein HDT28_02015 [Clostridiales bacterium]|nr:hypothetical protein [Clostridiales bacterium]
MEKISKGKKIFIAIVVIVTLIITIGGIGGFVKLGHDLGLEDQAIASEYKRYLADRGAYDDLIWVRLTKEATREFKGYAPEDFSDVGAIDVRLCNTYCDEYVRRKLQGLPVEEELDVEIDEYTRLLDVTLNKKSKKNVLQAIKILSARPDVAKVTPQMSLLSASAVSNDQYNSEQWGIKNASVDKAWGTLFDDDCGTVTVGILDSGIDAMHPDLRDKIYRSVPHDILTKLHQYSIKSV